MDGSLIYTRQVPLQEILPTKGWLILKKYPQNVYTSLSSKTSPLKINLLYSMHLACDSLDIAFGIKLTHIVSDDFSL